MKITVSSVSAGSGLSGVSSGAYVDSAGTLYLVGDGYVTNVDPSNGTIRCRYQVDIRGIVVTPFKGKATLEV